MARWRSIGHALREGAGGGAGEPERLWAPTDSGNLRLLLTAASFEPGVRWADQSGRGNHYTGAGGAEANQGAIETVIFDGDEHLDGPALSNFSDNGLMYASALVYATGDATTPMAAGVWAAVAGSDVPSQGIGYVKVGAENRFNALYHTASGGSGWKGADVEADADGKWVWVEVGFDGANVRARGTDASAPIDTTSTATTSAPWNMAQLTEIGRGVEVSNNLYYIGHIGMICVFRGAPSATDMTNMRAFMVRTYGIADPGSNLY